MEKTETPSAAENHKITLWQMALALLKIGAMGFGGGMAIIALMETDCVKKRSCVEVDDFLHGVGLGQILGPFAVNAAIFIGCRLFGLLGGLIGAVSFLLPSIVLVIVLSWLYVTFHHIPSLQGALVGLGPVVIALILSAAWSMGRKKLRSVVGAVIAAATCLAGVLHLNPIWTLLGAGLAGLALKLGPGPAQESGQSQSLPVIWAAGSVGNLAAPAPPLAAAGPLSRSAVGLAGVMGLIYLGWIFFKVGLVFFGGGFVLIPVLNHQLVNDLGWLTPQQFMDGVAISQLTPGPVAVLATFAGYLQAGVLGALVATAALFTPAMVLMLLLSTFYERLRTKRFAQDFLAGVEPAVIGLIVAAAIILAPGSISLARPLSIGLGLLALVLLTRFQWHPAFVLLIGAVAGIAAPGLLR
uniref:Chromate efflux transporter n=1 Tax=Desulfobacca acetoxidans TaxID=60893 RepID=A0A7C3YZ47_9BACT